jgi:formylmethanofuran dehydrogenase subunit E
MKTWISYEDLIAFHGHSCPGLAIGFRMTKAALNLLSDRRAKDEELVAIVENDACGVDALQYLSGCTFGKGNLIFKDYGKNTYTLYSRRSKKGVRVAFTPNKIPEDIRENREKLKNWILTAPEKDIVILREVHIGEPEPARIIDSVKCEFCNEYVMVTRTREIDGKIACIPCAETRNKS